MKKMVTKKRIWQWGGVVAVALIVAAFGFVKMPHYTAQAAQSLPNPTIIAHPGGDGNNYFQIDLPSAGPFTQDFHFIVSFTSTSGKTINFVSPWASQMANGITAPPWSVLAGGLSYDQCFNYDRAAANSSNMQCQVSESVCTEKPVITPGSCNGSGETCQGQGGQTSSVTCNGEWGSGNWSPWAYAGGSSPLLGDTIGGGGKVVILAEAKGPLPSGEIITNLVLGIQVANDNNGDLADTTKGSGGYIGSQEVVSPVSGSAGPVYTSDSTLGFVYDNNGNLAPAGYSAQAMSLTPVGNLGDTPDSVRMYMSDSLAGATLSSTNIPSTFMASQSVSTGSDNNPIEITVKNTGSVPWLSDQATVIPGSEQAGSKCDGGIVFSPNPIANEGYVGEVAGYDCPAATDAPGASCTASINNSSDVFKLKHTSSSFVAGSDPASYNLVTKNSCAISPASYPKCFNMNPLANAAACQASESACTEKPVITPGGCNGSGETCQGQGAQPPSTACEGTWQPYEFEVESGNPDIDPGATATFMLSSLTAPAALGPYTETWQMMDSGNPFGDVIKIPITVGVGGLNPSATITANPSTVTVGSFTNLTFTGTGNPAPTCKESGAWLSGDICSGTVPQLMQGLGVYTYIFTVTNSHGSATASTTVTVIASSTLATTGTLNVSSTNIVTGGAVVGSWSAFGGLVNETTTNETSASYKNLPLPGGIATYKITPGSAPNFAFGAVEKIGVARASKESVFANAFAMIHNAFTSVALADTQLVQAEVCVNNKNVYFLDPITEIYTCKGGPANSLTLTTATSTADAVIMWYPLAAINVTSTKVALDGSGNGQITVQNSGASGSGLIWTANTTSTWFKLDGSSTANGTTTNNAVQSSTNGATQNIAISVPNASTLSGNYTGTVQVTGTSKYWPANGNMAPLSPYKVTVNFTGTCTGSGCNVCTPPNPDCTPIVDNSAPTVSISPASSTIPLGQSQVLTITSTGADACVESGAWSGTKCSGAVTVTPNASGTFTYNIKATSTIGSATASATASATVTAQDVNGCPGPNCIRSQNYAPSCSLIASPTSIIVPASSTLSYYCTNVKTGSCTLSGGIFGTPPGTLVKINGTTAQGTTSDAPPQNTWYTINCSGIDTYSGTNASANAEVLVTNPGRSETNP